MNTATFLFSLSLFSLIVFLVGSFYNLKSLAKNKISPKQKNQPKFSETFLKRLKTNTFFPMAAFLLYFLVLFFSPIAPHFIFFAALLFAIASVSSLAFSYYFSKNNFYKQYKYICMNFLLSGAYALVMLAVLISTLPYLKNGGGSF